ncbi:hypothetical protein GCM10022282_03810 [Agromyces indicus]|uniref:ribonuclease E inhibitor RraB n=1 Tax=Agromyces indicus TaxID=758919 RepID=UPI0031D33D87
MGWFGKKKPALPSSGRAGDDMVMHQLDKHGADLTEPRHWVHYLYFADEAAAREAATAISAAGWELQLMDRAASEDGSWVVVPERHDVIVDTDSVREARMFFEGIVAVHPQAEYGGWEASI